MKLIHIFLGIALLMSTVGSRAQGILITDQEAGSAANSAILEMRSESKGFLPPRITTIQMEALAAPQAGMLIYNLDLHCPMLYNGSDWVDLNGRSIIENLEIGDEFQGGIVFHLDGNGGGYVATADDFANGYDAYFTWDEAMAEAAAYSASSFDDWVLPSLELLEALYAQQAQVSGFERKTYWTADEFSTTRAAAFDFKKGVAYSAMNKSANYRIRLIRAF